jgi:hypothetical protein
MSRQSRSPRLVWLTAITSSVIAAASLGVACAEIPAPTPRPDVDPAPADAAVGDDAGADAGAPRACVKRGWRTLSNLAPLVEGDAPGTLALIANGNFEERDDAGAGRFIYQMALVGRAEGFPDRAPVELGTGPNASPDTCAYCGSAFSGCRQVSADAITCADEYTAVAGRARTVQMATEHAAPYWVEVADLVLARVHRDSSGTRHVDETDCVVLDRLILQGSAHAVTRPCSPESEVYCRLADTASSRGP